MSNADLANDLRDVLKTLVVNGNNLTDAAIDHFTSGEIKEIEIEMAIPTDLVADQAYITGLVAALHNALTARANVAYDAAAFTYNLAGYGLSGPVAMTAGEDLSAIKKFGDLGTCDLVKAITNILRTIKAAGIA